MSDSNDIRQALPGERAGRGEVESLHHSTWDEERFAESIDCILEVFEQNWTPDLDYLEWTASQYGILDVPDALAEVVRADLDRRYSVGLSLELDDYFARFPILLTRRTARIGIAFEDFRARCSRGLSVDRDRWGDIAGVSDEAWYGDLPVHKLEYETRAGLANANRTLRTEDYSAHVSEPRVGEDFGDFHLIHMLGSGTFSKVFLAEQKSLASRYVAVKVVLRALEEPFHLARLQHTGIVPLYSFHRIGQYSVLCMPYSGAATLADWMMTFTHQRTRARTGQALYETICEFHQRVTIATTRRSGEVASEGANSTANLRSNTYEPDAAVTHPMSIWNEDHLQPLHLLRELDVGEFAIWFAQRIGSALAHAHSRGIIHGDLKPANILIRNDGEPALIDFNLACRDDALIAERVGGTLPYMSPEQYRGLLGRSSLTTASSDVYSLGVILYELIEGKLPFAIPRSASESDLSLALSDRQNSIPADVARKRRQNAGNKKQQQAGTGLRAIIAKCLAFSPDDRYQDAIQLLQDLERERAHRPLLYAKENWRQRFVKFSKRHPRFFSAGIISVAFVTLILSATSIGYLLWTQSQILIAKEAVRELEKMVVTKIPVLIEQNADDYINSDYDASILDDSMALDNRVMKWLDGDLQYHAESLAFDLHLATAYIALEKSTRRREPYLALARQHLAASKHYEAHYAASRIIRYLEQRVAGESHGSDSIKLEEATRSDSLYTSEMDAILTARLLIATNSAVTALQALRTVDQKTPHTYLFWMTTAQAQLQLGQPQSAVLSFSMAIHRYPEASGAYIGRARAYVAMGDFRSGLKDYSAAVERDGTAVSPLADRALVYETIGDYPAAMKDIETALARAPESNRLLLIRSRLKQSIGDVKGSRDDLDKALQSKPHSVEDYVSRALSRLNHDASAALVDLEDALHLDRDSILVLQNIAHVKSEYLGDAEGGITALERILELQPENEMARAGLAVLFARSGKVEAALKQANIITKRSTNLLPSTIYQLACTHALVSKQRPYSVSESVRLLTRAVRAEYGIELLDNDPDLAPIRNEPQFLRLRSLIQLSNPDNPSQLP